MSQPSNPQSSTTSTTISESPLANTKLGKSAKFLVTNLLEFIDQIFYGLMGQLGRTVYASIQDAIALIILLTIPNLIGQIIFGKDFSNFHFCLQENALGASRYACFVIVASDFLLWIIIAGRIIARFWAELKTLNKP
ncbi:MAG TPA: hypothetical protein VK203_02325 [Nostocaceae cyanobacterium]|nr:hypothetical protein [Nostocaceae cyanobacterium]